ncbi:MAG: DEAD/DEAH box helicase [Bacteroidota bacterium]|jgi:ATP-dependent RNA helicase DeaD
MNEFDALGLSENLLKAIKELGFENPTPIQQKSIPLLLSTDTDLVGLAQTGTGKTAAFGLPMCHKTDFSRNAVQGLIICPTRELCLQIASDLAKFLAYTPGARVVSIYGGASIENQTREIQRGAHIIVATPGRMVDMINRGRVRLSEVKYVVLDEADEMLNMGFKEDLDIILGQTPEEKNTWLFSATMPPEVARIARNYMEKPAEVTVGKQNAGADNIEHHYYVVQSRDRYACLKRIVDYYPSIFGIVFCRTRSETQEIADKLMRDGYNADALHGDLSQSQRDHVMKRYRSRSLQMLVATDVAARGIDVNDVTHVINYNLPDDTENYTHRSGRTARAGKSGISIIILNIREASRIREIERIINKKFTKKNVPTGPEICEKQLFHLVKKIHDTEVSDEEISDFLPPINEMLKDLSREELIKRMVATDFNRFLDYYRDAHDLNVESREKGVRERREFDKREGSPRENGRREELNGRFFINLGEMDGLSKSGLRDLIADNGGISAKDVGRIDLKNTFSFFDVDPSLAKIVYKNFYKKEFNGRFIKVQAAESGGGGGRSGGYSAKPERRNSRRERFGR